MLQAKAQQAVGTAVVGSPFTASIVPPARLGRRSGASSAHTQQFARSVQCGAGCVLKGVGSSVPATFLTNTDLERLVDTSDEWITSRTGIKKRHILGKGETLAQHAVAASKKALEMAGVAAADIDLVLFATSSPDDVFGSACQVRLLAEGDGFRLHANWHRNACTLATPASASEPLNQSALLRGLGRRAGQAFRIFILGNWGQLASSRWRRGVCSARDAACPELHPAGPSNDHMSQAGRHARPAAPHLDQPPAADAVFVCAWF